ncbi:MAG TPA: HEAT repeat domain-containing protein [Gemmatimonadaceae bacterium]|nr:HEAT repeat domain-containing protein [Gemmatimonadaceae bacterium]
MHRHVVLVLALAVIAPRAGRAQSLEDRIAAASGPAAFEFTTRDNVCGDGDGIFIADSTPVGWNLRPHRSGMHLGRGGNDDGPCEIAPARAVVGHEGKRVTSIRISVGGSAPRLDGNIGRVPAEEAARFLLAVAPQLTGRSADEAITGASVADVPRVWPRLLEIARDGTASESSRKTSLFWLSHEAAAAAVAGLGAIAEDDATSLSVRRDALFHLAQRRDGAGIESLIRIVRQSKSRSIRKDALWHLGQSGDPRAIALFAELLAGR